MQELSPENSSRKSTVEGLTFYLFCGLFFFLPIATSPAVIIGIVALSLWVFSGTFYKRRHKWLSLKWAPVYLIVLLSWAGLLYVEDASIGLDFAKKTYYWLFAFALASISLSTDRVRTLLGAFIAGLSVVSVFSIIQYLRGEIMHSPIPTLLWKKAITGSLLLVLGILFVSWYFSKAETKGKKLASIAIIALFFVTLAVCPGRTGYVTFVLLLPLIIHNLLNKKKIILGVALSVFVLLALFSSPTVRQRLSLAAKNIHSYAGGEATHSVGKRFYMWQGALSIFMEEPVLGSGTGGYVTGMRRFKHETSLPVPYIEGDISDPHNSYLYMAANYGMVGLLTLLWLLVILLKNGYKYRSSIAGYSILAFTLVFSIGSLANTLILSYQMGVMLAAIRGMQEHLE